MLRVALALSLLLCIHSALAVSTSRECDSNGNCSPNLVGVDEDVTVDLLQKTMHMAGDAGSVAGAAAKPDARADKTSKAKPSEEGKLKTKGQKDELESDLDDETEEETENEADAEEDQEEEDNEIALAEEDDVPDELLGIADVPWKLQIPCQAYGGGRRRGGGQYVLGCSDNDFRDETDYASRTVTGSRLQNLQLVPLAYQSSSGEEFCTAGFYASNDGNDPMVVFYVPTSSGTTSGSTSPRVELRQDTPGWSLSDNRAIEVNAKVNHVPAVAQSVAVTQVFDGGAPGAFIEIMTRVCREGEIDTTGTTCQEGELMMSLWWYSDITHLSHYTLGQKFTLRISTSANEVSFVYTPDGGESVTTTKTCGADCPASTSSGLYFKAGAYLQKVTDYSDPRQMLEAPGDWAEVNLYSTTIS